MNQKSSLLILLFLVFNLTAQTTFKKSYATPLHNHHFIGSIVLSDSSIIMAGYSDLGHSYIIRTKHNGDTIWTRAFGSHQINSIAKSSDDAIIIVGGGVQFAKLAITKLNKSGQILWHKFLGSYYDGSAIHVTLCANNGFIISGSTAELISNNLVITATIIKTDSLGNIAWTRRLDTPFDDRAQCAIELQNKDIMVCGLTVTTPMPQNWLLKLDSSGVLIWTKQITTIYHNFIQLLDGGNNQIYILSQNKLIKLDTSGNNANVKSYAISGSNIGFRSMSLVDNYLLLNGGIIKNNKSEGLFIKADLQGDTLFARKYKESGIMDSESLMSSHKHPKKGYVLTGDLMPGGHNYYMIVTDSIGRTACNWSVAPIMVTTNSLQLSLMVFTVSTFTATSNATLQRISMGLTPQTICESCVSPSEPINLTLSKNKIVCASKSATLTASGSGTVQWYSSPTSSVVVGTGAVFVTPTLSPGTYTYYVSAKTCTVSLSRTMVTFTVVSCTSIEEQDLNYHISVSPNPFKGNTTINFLGFIPDLVQLFNSEGKCLFTWKSIDHQINILEGDLNPGFYFIKVSKDSKIFTRKIIALDY